MADRVSQVAVEGLIGGDGNARVSQEAVEVLRQHQPITNVGVSQIAVEVLVPKPLNATRFYAQII